MERLRLRADLQERHGPDGALVGLHDPLLDRQVDLGPIARALIARMPDTSSGAELVARVAGETGFDRPRVEESLRSFLLLHVVEGSPILARARRVLASQVPIEAVTLDGARFQCQGSGGCCQGYAFGPLLESDVARLEALDLAGAGFGPGPHVDVRGADRYLRTTEDGRCVFLRQDHRCGVHAAFGAGAKPTLCQLYPIRALATIDGLKLYDGGECSTFTTSGRTGPLIAEDAPRIVPLLRGASVVQHPTVYLDEKLGADFGFVLAMQSSVAERLARPLGAGAALREATRLLRASVSALATCPLEPGGGEAALASLDVSSDRASEEELARGAAALVAVVEDLLALYLRAAQAARGPGEASAFVAILALAHKLLAASAGAAEVVLVGDHASVARVARAGPDFDEPLRLSLRSTIWGDQLLVDRCLLPGVVRLAAATYLTAIGAQLHAHGCGSGRVRGEDLSFAQSTVLRLLRRPGSKPIWAKHASSAWDLAEAVATALDS